jgi:rare lipoprotein A
MQNKIRALLSLFICILLAGCASMSQHNIPANTKTSYVQNGKKYKVMTTSRNYAEQGTASWYGRRFHKKRTSSGERYNMYKYTAAHKTLPLSTYVRVTNLYNGRQVVVKVNDRGPFVSNRLIDLSYAAAKKIGIIGLGTAPVEVKAI